MRFDLKAGDGVQKLKEISELGSGSEIKPSLKLNYSDLLKNGPTLIPLIIECLTKTPSFYEISFEFDTELPDLTILSSDIYQPFKEIISNIQNHVTILKFTGTRLIS